MLYTLITVTFLFDIIDNEDPNDRFMVGEADNVTENKGWCFSSLLFKYKYNVSSIYQTDIRKKVINNVFYLECNLTSYKFCIYYNYIVNTVLLYCCEIV